MQQQLGSSVEETDLALVWQGLRAGQLFLAESHYAAGRCFATLEARDGSVVARPSYSNILERVFQGESQKALACELGVSVATVACYCAQALSAVTSPGWVSRAPIILVMAALAGTGVPLGLAQHELKLDERRYVISVEIPGLSFRDRLSSSEWQVAQLSIEGEPHERVARARRTSLRTVANQLASAFAKLDVSGRAELRAKAVHEYASRLQTQPPAPSRLASPRMSLAELGARRRGSSRPPLLAASA